jgi:hypothetical protein
MFHVTFFSPNYLAILDLILVNKGNYFAVRARKISKYIWQPKQKLNAAFKKAAASAKATATVKTPPAPATDAITATSEKPSPTA